jgi:hypothetical protein
MSRPERQVKIGLLSRANRGRAEIPRFLHGLSDALGEPVESSSLADLADTDALSAAFRASYEQTAKGIGVSFRNNFEAKDRLAVFRIVDCFADRLREEQVFLMTKLSEICGAVLIRGAVVFRHAEPLLRLDGDSVAVLSSDRTQGFLLDFNPEDPGHVYEVAVWGDRWPVLILGCLP